MTHEFKTPDHPEANGRKATFGDQEYLMTYPVENGDVVVIRMGKIGYDTVTNHLVDMMSNAPSHDDGSLDRAINPEKPS